MGDVFTDGSDSANHNYSRGPIAQTVEQGTDGIEKSLPIEQSTWQYLQQAFDEGDRLPNTPEKLDAEINRRALIVAPQYGTGPKGFDELPSTLNDVLYIYKMLEANGYERENIRILTDGFEFNGLTDPTRQNILDSLKWLTKSARPNDYRYFHFSGHGSLYETSKCAGKETRHVPIDQESKPRHDDTELGKSPKSNKQIKSQVIHKQELRYYQEAIVTCFKTAPHTFKEQKEHYNLIFDKLLNEHFSELPKGCVLTCTLDCCHGGRMLNSNVKLKGPGFRGRMNTPVNAAFAESPEFPSEMNKLSLNTPRDSDSDPAYSHQSLYLPPGYIRMEEELPAHEKARDKIKATMVSWSGCHQRQKAIDLSNKGAGLFTRAFTEVVSTMATNNARRPTVEEVFDQVNLRVAKDADELNLLQYAQVWTSLAGSSDGEKVKRETLAQGFII